MNVTGSRLSPVDSWLRIGSVAAACAIMSACSWMPKMPSFSSSKEPKAVAAAPITDQGLGRTAVTSEDTKNVVSFISQSKFGYVRVERAEASAAGANDHPVNLTAAQIKSMLSKLQVRRADSDPEQIFTEDELKEVSAPLAQALAKAGPREDVTFAVSDKHGGTLGPLAARTVTSGRVFHKSGTLNLIFGEVHGQFEHQFLATGWLRPFVAGSRATTGAGQWSVTSAEPVRYAVAGRADWVQLAEAAGAPAVTAAPAAGSAAPTAAPATVAPVPAVVPNKDSLYQDIEKRLSVLKGLREKGLITEDEFNEKRKAILKDL